MRIVVLTQTDDKVLEYSIEDFTRLIVENYKASEDIESAVKAAVRDIKLDIMRR